MRRLGRRRRKGEEGGKLRRGIKLWSYVSEASLDTACCRSYGYQNEKKEIILVHGGQHSCRGFFEQLKISYRVPSFEDLTYERYGALT